MKPKSSKKRLRSASDVATQCNFDASLDIENDETEVSITSKTCASQSESLGESCSGDADNVGSSSRDATQESVQKVEQKIETSPSIHQNELCDSDTHSKACDPGPSTNTKKDTKPNSSKNSTKAGGIRVKPLEELLIDGSSPSQFMDENKPSTSGVSTRTEPVINEKQAGTSVANESLDQSKPAKSTTSRFRYWMHLNHFLNCDTNTCTAYKTFRDHLLEMGRINSQDILLITPRNRRVTTYNEAMFLLLCSQPTKCSICMNLLRHIMCMRCGCECNSHQELADVVKYVEEFIERAPIKGKRIEYFASAEIDMMHKVLLNDFDDLLESCDTWKDELQDNTGNETHNFIKLRELLNLISNIYGADSKIRPDRKILLISSFKDSKCASEEDYWNQISQLLENHYGCGQSQQEDDVSTSSKISTSKSPSEEKHDQNKVDMKNHKKHHENPHLYKEIDEAFLKSMISDLILAEKQNGKSEGHQSGASEGSLINESGDNFDNGSSKSIAEDIQLLITLYCRKYKEKWILRRKAILSEGNVDNVNPESKIPEHHLKNFQRIENIALAMSKIMHRPPTKPHKTTADSVITPLPEFPVKVVQRCTGHSPSCFLCKTVSSRAHEQTEFEGLIMPDFCKMERHADSYRQEEVKVYDSKKKCVRKICPCKTNLTAKQVRCIQDNYVQAFDKTTNVDTSNYDDLSKTTGGDHFQYFEGLSELLDVNLVHVGIEDNRFIKMIWVQKTLNTKCCLPNPEDYYLSMRRHMFYPDEDWETVFCKRLNQIFFPAEKLGRAKSIRPSVWFKPQEFYRLTRID